MQNVCALCFDDADLRDWIRDRNGPRGCWACGKRDSATAPLDSIGTFIFNAARRRYGLAVDQLMYNSREGGYLGDHWDSADTLTMLGLGFPRDRGRLHDAIVRELGEEPWCDFDVGGLDLHLALRLSWDEFCETIKHKRRFFFHETGRDERDSWTPMSLLKLIATTLEEMSLISEIPVGTCLWRARSDLRKRVRAYAEAFGPPPPQLATQSNRMNPAGIPMLYVASSIPTSLKETRATEARVGLWVVASELRVLDLRKLPGIPGPFSNATRSVAHTIHFLHSFSDHIMQPVERSDRVNVDYLPSQVVTEFVRDFPFANGKLDGIAYNSTVHKRGWNLALFLEPEQLGIAPRRFGRPSPSLLSFGGDRWARLSP